MTAQRQTSEPQINCGMCGRRFGEGDIYISVEVEAKKLGRDGVETVEHSEVVTTLCTDCARAHQVSSEVPSTLLGDGIGRTLTIVAPADAE